LQKGVTECKTIRKGELTETDTVVGSFPTLISKFIKLATLRQKNKYKKNNTKHEQLTGYDVF